MSSSVTYVNARKRTLEVAVHRELTAHFGAKLGPGHATARKHRIQSLRGRETRAHPREPLFDQLIRAPGRRWKRATSRSMSRASIRRSTTSRNPARLTARELDEENRLLGLGKHDDVPIDDRHNPIHQFGLRQKPDPKTTIKKRGSTRMPTAASMPTGNW